LKHNPGSNWLSQLAQLIGSLSYAAAMWLLALILIHQTGIEGYGRYASALAVCGPIFMFANARGRLLVSSAADLPAPVSAYVEYRAISSVVAGFFCLGLAWGVMDNGFTIVLTVALFKGIEAFSDILFGVLQRNDRAALVGVSQCFKSTLLVMLLLLGLVLEIETTASFVGLLAAGLAGSLTLDALLVRSHHASKIVIPHPRTLHPVFAHLRPMMAIAFLASLFSMLPRIFLSQYHGYAEVGRYSALMLLSAAAMIVIAALGQPYLRGIGAAKAAGDVAALRQFLLKMLLIVLGVTTSFALVLAVGGERFFSVFLDSQDPVSGQIVILLLSVIFLNGLCLMQWFALAAIGIRRAQVWLAAVMLAAMMIICFFLVPPLAETGALLSDVLALSLQGLLASVILVRALHRRPEKLNTV